MQSHPHRLILASTSVYRKALLERLKLNFEQHAPKFEESVARGESPGAAAVRLATGKAASLVGQYSPAVIIGSDQVAALNGRIISKPGSLEMARRQLIEFSDRSVEFHTAACILNTENKSPLTHLDRTLVRFRTLLPEEIERYLTAEPALDCTGAFKAEALGISLFESIESTDPTALLGLPLIATAQLLRSAGIPVP